MKYVLNQFIKFWNNEKLFVMTMNLLSIAILACIALILR